MSKHQKQVYNRIFHKEERELHNVQFLEESNGFSLQKLVAPAYPCTGQYHSQYLSIEILNILYDRHGLNPGFWFLMSFEHLNLDT